METFFDTPLANRKTDTAQRAAAIPAHRVFEQFLSNYQAILVRVEDYLEEVIEKTDPAYGGAYIPWKNALHELLNGAYLIAKKIPLPNKEDFMDALCMFSFESTIKFLRDVCTICQLKLKKEWEHEFREHINQLLFTISNLNQKQQASLAR